MSIGMPPDASLQFQANPLSFVEPSTPSPLPASSPVQETPAPQELAFPSQTLTKEQLQQKAENLRNELEPLKSTYNELKEVNVQPRWIKTEGGELIKEKAPYKLAESYIEQRKGSLSQLINKLTEELTTVEQQLKELQKPTKPLIQETPTTQKAPSNQTPTTGPLAKSEEGTHTLADQLELKKKNVEEIKERINDFNQVKIDGDQPIKETPPIKAYKNSLQKELAKAEKELAEAEQKLTESKQSPVQETLPNQIPTTEPLAKSEEGPHTLANKNITLIKPPLPPLDITIEAHAHSISTLSTSASTPTLSTPPSTPTSSPSPSTPTSSPSPSTPTSSTSPKIKVTSSASAPSSKQAQADHKIKNFNALKALNQTTLDSLKTQFEKIGKTLSSDSPFSITSSSNLASSIDSKAFREDVLKLKTAGFTHEQINTELTKMVQTQLIAAGYASKEGKSYFQKSAKILHHVLKNCNEAIDKAKTLDQEEKNASNACILSLIAHNSMGRASDYKAWEKEMSAAIKEKDIGNITGFLAQNKKVFSDLCGSLRVFENTPEALKKRLQSNSKDIETCREAAKNLLESEISASRPKTFIEMQLLNLMEEQTQCEKKDSNPKANPFYGERENKIKQLANEYLDFNFHIPDQQELDILKEFQTKRANNSLLAIAIFRQPEPACISKYRESHPDARIPTRKDKVNSLLTAGTISESATDFLGSLIHPEKYPTIKLNATDNTYRQATANIAQDLSTRRQLLLEKLNTTNTNLAILDQDSDKLKALVTKSLETAVGEAKNKTYQAFIDIAKQSDVDSAEAIYKALVPSFSKSLIDTANQAMKEGDLTTAKLVYQAVASDAALAVKYKVELMFLDQEIQMTLIASIDREETMGLKTPSSPIQAQDRQVSIKHLAKINKDLKDIDNQIAGIKSWSVLTNAPSNDKFNQILEEMEKKRDALASEQATLTQKLPSLPKLPLPGKSSMAEESRYNTDFDMLLNKQPLPR